MIKKLWFISKINDILIIETKCRHVVDKNIVGYWNSVNIIVGIEQRRKTRKKILIKWEKSLEVNIVWTSNKSNIRVRTIRKYNTFMFI